MRVLYRRSHSIVSPFRPSLRQQGARVQQHVSYLVRAMSQSDGVPVGITVRGVCRMAAEKGRREGVTMVQELA